MLFVTVWVSLTDAAMCISLIFVKHSDIVRYFLDIVIFDCANTTAFPMSD